MIRYKNFTKNKPTNTILAQKFSQKYFEAVIPLFEY